MSAPKRGKDSDVDGAGSKRGESRRKQDGALAAIINAKLIESPDVRTYQDTEALHQPGTGQDLQDWIKQTANNGATGLTAEYQAIRKEQPTSTYKVCQANKEKNRYVDVLCYDHTRVKLVDGYNGDYIHGNYTDGFKHRKRYICTQGPTRNTLVDYWRMIWQEKTLVIVMTTRLSERNREKCTQYWPASTRKNMRYGPFIVGIKKEVQERDYDLTYLHVKNTREGKDRVVCHLLYHAWPDYKVPKSPSGYLEFVKFVHHLQATMLTAQFPRWSGHPCGPPVVIHCSAGIGRTGTFLAIDISLQRLIETGKVDVTDVVRKIRSQRMHSIQTAEQYMFIHLVLIEYAVNNNLYQPEKLNLQKFVEDGEAK